MVSNLSTAVFLFHFSTVCVWDAQYSDDVQHTVDPETTKN